MSVRIELHPTARQVVTRLNDAGYEAYVVGGCVRDALRGVTADDWDICTSALPDDTERVFSDCKTIDIGKKHGTIAVLFGGQKFEITTFRQDGGYSDARHPESVSFDATLEADLARRDFTINAMAADANGNVTDPFDGHVDLEHRVIRCVGYPNLRFSEDALRIMRALRFSATLGFELDGPTSAAARELSPLIRRISGERILVELSKLLCGVDALRVLMTYPDVLSAAIPEISPCVGFEHRNNWHCYDVWEHTCRAIALSPRDERVRLALLFHDLAKPQCSLDKADGRRSFHGHPEASCEIAKTRLAALHASGALRDGTAELVLLHDEALTDRPANVAHFLRRLGEEQFRLLCEVQLADALAHNMEYPPAVERVERIRRARELAEGLISGQAPYAPSMLALHGDELIALGAQPAEVGRILCDLCDDVLCGETVNDRAALLERAKRYI